MFEKNMRLCLLLDFYGDVLEERAGAILRAYYEDDLSLSEIAAGEGISRQGVRHVIKKAEEELEFLEEKLGLCAHYAELRAEADNLAALRDDLLARGLDGEAKILSAAIEKILEKPI